MRKLLLILLLAPLVAIGQITESQVKTQITTRLSKAPRAADYRFVLNLITDYTAQADSTALANTGGGGGSETDPVFEASPAADITAPDIANWQNLVNNVPGYITANSSSALTNKTGNISMWTNNSGYAVAATVASTYQTLANLSTDMTASASKYPSVNAVNTALLSYAPNVLTGFVSGAGTVSATDNVLQAIQKLNGNIAAINAAGYVTASSSNAFTNKTGNISQWTNDSGYLPSATAASTYQTLAKLSTDLTPSAVNYPSVNAVNTGLALKGNLSGGNTWLGTQSFSNAVISALPALGTKPTKVLVDNAGEISSRTIEEFRQDLFDPLSESRVAYAEAQGNSTSINSLGLGITAVGTATTRPVNHSTSNPTARQRRLGYVGATSANSSAGITCQAQFSTYYGFIFRGRFSIQAYDAGHRYICGIGETTTNTVEPSTLLNRVHMYADAGMTTWRVVSADGTTVGTPVDLGANFPVNTSAADVYELTVEAPSNTGAIKWTVKRIGTAFSATGTFSTNLPVGSTLLSPQVFASNAATGTAASINIMRITMFTDY